VPGSLVGEYERTLFADRGLVVVLVVVFGSVLTPGLFGGLSLGGYVAVLLAIVLIRPVSLLLSLAGTRIDRREKYTAAWFGPKGFASVVYGLLVLQSGIPHGQQAYTLIAVCIAFSIVAQSSTDVPLARMFDVEDLVGIPDDDAPGAETTAGEGDGPARGETSGGARVPKPAARREETGDARI
jgi:NhaP-type Na+/H+ or K+/H+ antiporter